MGEGDFKLMAALGAWLGWQDLPFLLFLASLLGVLGSAGKFFHRALCAAKAPEFFGGAILDLARACPWRAR